MSENQIPQKDGQDPVQAPQPSGLGDPPESRRDRLTDRAERVLAELDERQTTPLRTLTARGQPPKEWCEVVNKTARKLFIKVDEETTLVLPPHGSLNVSAELHDSEVLRKWRQRGLVSSGVKVERTSESVFKDMAFGCGSFIFFADMIAVLVGLVVRDLRTDPQFWYSLGGSIVLIVAIFAGMYIGWGRLYDRLSRGVQWIAQPLNVIFIFMVGLGLPGLIIYVFGGGREILSSAPSNLALLGRGLQFAVIGIASLLPALLYFLFDRQRVSEVKSNFYREVMRLDPDIQTTVEAKTKYGQLVDQTYGSSGATGFLLGTGSPILISTLLITIVWTLVLLPVGSVDPMNHSDLESLIMPRQNALNFGMLGVYFFAINMLFRRYVRADLTPKAYTHITLRLLTTIVLVWAVSTLPILSNQESGEAGSLLMALAFIIGIFPETGLVLLQDALLRNKLTTKVMRSLEVDHPVTNLEGINLYDQARLLEEGIESVENLAHHNLIELMLRTRIPTPRLVDLFDQAILYLHTSDLPTEQRKKLRQHGIRTATDLEQVCKAAGDGTEAQALLRLLDEKTADGSPPEVIRLQIIKNALQDDEWMPHLRNWRRFGQATPYATAPEDFGTDPSATEESDEAT